MRDRVRRRDLIAALTGLATGGDVGSHIRPDPPELLDFATTHGLSGIVADSLSAPGAGADSAGSSLRAVRAECVARNLRLADAALQTGEILEARGIPYAVVKGPVLAATHHTTPAARTAVDVDVLVPPSQFGEAVAALRAAGMLLRARNWPLLCQRAHAELTLSTPTGVPVDLHWSLVPERDLRRERRLDTVELLSRCRRVEIAPGATVPTLDPTDTLIHLCVHGADSGGDRLLWLFDVHSAVVSEPPDWPEVIARAARYRVGAQVALMLSRAGWVFGTEVPLDLGRRLGQEHWVLASRIVDRLSPPCLSYPYRSASRWLARGVREEWPPALRSLVGSGAGWLRTGGFVRRPRSDEAFGSDDPRDAFYDGGGSLQDYLRVIDWEAGA